MVGERGCQLSGGQKQRIAIARALIQDPSILLLDEATSALDPQSEKSVQETLTRLSRGRTTVVVSHRQSAIRSADRIVCLAGGRIAEDGTHEELMRLQGVYYKMMKTELRSTDGDEDDTDAPVVSNDDVIAEKILHKDMFNQPPQQQLQHKYTQTMAPHRTSTTSISSCSNIDGCQTDENAAMKAKDSIQIFHNLKRILLMVRAEWLLLSAATVSSVLIGASFPAFAVVFGEFYSALSIVDPGQAVAQMDKLCAVVLVLAIAIGLLALIQSHLFNQTGVKLTMRMRAAIFDAMIRQDASWFDDSRNGIGALSVQLTSEAAGMQAVSELPFDCISKLTTIYTPQLIRQSDTRSAE